MRSEPPLFKILHSVTSPLVLLFTATRTEPCSLSRTEINEVSEFFSMPVTQLGAALG